MRSGCRDHYLFMLMLTLSTFAVQGDLQAQFSLQGPGVNPSDFRVTTFASGLNYPVGMTELDDGSMLVAVSNGSNFFGSTSGAILRLVDTDDDGVADQQTTLVNNVPGGGLSALRRSGDLVFTTGQGSGKPISIYRLGNAPNDPLSLVGSLSVNYPGGGWLHPHSALAAREISPGTHELYFQLGSQANFATTTVTATLTSTIGVNGSLAGDALHRVTIMDNGTSVSGTDLTQIATGLRNAAGFDFHPTTGDLYLEDNGIDGLTDPNEPFSADELNVIAAADIGGAVESFGFPDTYVAYRTGQVVGNTGIQPLVAFQPIDGAEGEGPNDIAFAPPRFPTALRDGVFVGMHGKYSLGGVSNEENPLVFADLRDNSYFHFIGNDEPMVGHLDGLMTTQDSLFVADISPDGGFGGSSGNSGKIYQIKSLLITGDFDLDGDYSCADVDALVTEIVAGTNDSSFDLSGDGLVNPIDLTAWLAEAGMAELPSGNPYPLADGNLSGDVDISDFNVWNANKFTSNSAWCGGDFNADGFVDVGDFNLWNGNKFTSAAMAVPETQGWGMVLFVMWVCLAGQRHVDEPCGRSFRRCVKATFLEEKVAWPPGPCGGNAQVQDHRFGLPHTAPSNRAREPYPGLIKSWC